MPKWASPTPRTSGFYAFLFSARSARSGLGPGAVRAHGFPGDRSGCRKIIKYTIAVNAVVVLPLVLVGCLVSGYIMGAYGPAFAEHSTVLIVAVITGGVLAIQIPMGQMTAASGRMWTEICMNLGWALVFVCGTWLTVSYGALGLVSARLAAYVLHTIWTAGFVAWLLRAGNNVVDSHPSPKDET